jgi:hypothetical protein
MSWFKPDCAHVWKIMDKHIEPPKAKFAEAGRLQGHDVIMGFHNLCKATYICIMVCEKCGAVDKTVEKV